MEGNFFLGISLAAVLFAAVLLSGLYFLPWQNTNWGKLEFSSPQTITVTGTAEDQVKNQIATFNAGVSKVGDDKQAAIDEVNQKVNAIIDAVKNFGVKTEDIKSQNLNIYQEQETYYDNGVQKRREGQWNVSNTVAITLRDIDSASQLADLLGKSGATNVYGPNFSLDNTVSAEDKLLKEAIANARQKAVIMAGGSDKLGKILNVSEGYQSSQPIYAFRDGAGGGGAALEPGSGTVSKSVTVVFELK